MRRDIQQSRQPRRVHHLSTLETGADMQTDHYNQIVETAWPAVQTFSHKGPFDKDERDRRTQLFLECLLLLVDTRGAWEAIPARYGSAANVYQRFNRWCRSGRVIHLFNDLNARGGFPYACDGRKIFRKDNPECYLPLSRRRVRRR